MSLITTVSHGNYKDQPRRSYLTTAAYNDYVYLQTITTDPRTGQTSGVLRSLTTTNSALYTSAACPANRVLIENGKKLFPNAALGVYQYMVGVYDPISFTSGYIDPNDEIFAVMNTDKPAYLGRATNSVTGSSTVGEKAPPVYSDGFIYSTQGIGYPTGAGGTVTQLTDKSTAVTLNAPTGQITMNNANLAATTTVAFTLNNTYIAANDYILVQNISGAANLGTYNVTAVAATNSAVISVRNLTGGILGEALVLKFVVIKSAIA